ncbi:hypothetical protein GQ607_002377 [Colletotrichum asianum]|uniref:F-box domain-containing protein n=1 Tax=Colletotrichum asianum TaxID=702518 RepID=A0A8H3WTG5_9PEZI|nr:hypothetical protein GQ607_002377 [Colletotrichum asianum]
MNRAPGEIIEEIASYLPFSDLLSFSLDLAVLNTTSCLSDFEKTVGSGTLCTRHLSLYHGTWPACARDDWETHPLQVVDAHHSIFASQDRRALSDELAQQAFDAYYNFIREEHFRDKQHDQAQLARILSQMPLLEKITVSSLVRKRLGRLGQTKLYELRHRIRMSPTIFDSVGNLVERLFLLLPSFCNIRSIHIQGKLIDFPAPTLLDGVKELNISALSLMASKTTSFVDFMRSFPNLERLSLSPYRHLGLICPLAEIHYPRLREASFNGFWLSKELFLDFLARHAGLRSMTLEEIMLADSSWRLVLSEIGDVQGIVQLQNCS